MHAVESPAFLPSEVAAAAWRESMLLWGVQGGKSGDIAGGLLMRRGVGMKMGVLMAAAKVRGLV